MWSRAPKVGLLVASATLPAAEAAPTPISVEASIDRFVDVCAKGSGRFTPGSVEPLGFRKLPDPVRDYFGKVDDGSFYKLRAEKVTYLLNFHPTIRRGDEYKQICAIVIRDIPFIKALRLIAPRLGIALPGKAPRGSYGIDFFMPKYGFQLKVRDIGTRLNNGAPIGYSQVLLQISPYREIVGRSP